jgi:hypothetical protein
MLRPADINHGAPHRVTLFSIACPVLVKCTWGGRPDAYMRGELAAMIRRDVATPVCDTICQLDRGRDWSGKNEDFGTGAETANWHVESQDWTLSRLEHARLARLLAG